MPISVLDELGIRHVTDKSSLDHDYLRHYERLFAPFRDEPITLLEIGVADGGSLCIWEDYFPRASIVGMDIRESCRKHAGGRRIIEIASQDDEAALTRLGNQYRPQIIIDDGSHRADHILTSFSTLFPWLRAGEIYIVEDLAMHIGPGAERMRGSAAETPQAYFLRLANAVACPGDSAFDHRIFGPTESVEFFYCVAVIRKKLAPEANRIEGLTALVDGTQSAKTFSWFSGYILRNGGSKEKALEYAKKGAEDAPTAALQRVALSRALEAAGRREEAAVAARESVQLEPANIVFAELARRLEA